MEGTYFPDYGLLSCAQADALAPYTEPPGLFSLALFSLPSSPSQLALQVSLHPSLRSVLCPSKPHHFCGSSPHLRGSFCIQASLLWLAKLWPQLRVLNMKILFLPKSASSPVFSLSFDCVTVFLLPRIT